MRYLSIFLCILALAGSAAGLLSGDSPYSAQRFLSGRTRVIVVRDPQAVIAFTPQPDKIDAMVEMGLLQMTGQSTAAHAWQSLVSTQDLIGIKVYSAPGPMSGTRPSVVAALVRSLLAAGIPPKRILVWDKHIADLRLAGFFELAERYGVRVAGSAEEGYDDKVFYPAALTGKLIWGDLEFGKAGPGIGRNSFVSKLLTQRITKIIHVTPLLNHNLAGVSGNLYGLAFGSVDNTIRFESSMTHFHAAIPELYAMPEIGDRVVLNIVDALICQYQGEERTLLHYAAMLGELRFSKDPVALDVLSIQELNRQRQLAKIPGLTKDFQVYTNAALLQLGVTDLNKVDIETLP